MMHMTGYPKGAPITMGAPLGNLFGGMHLAIAIISGVMHARNGGEGQFIDVAASDALCAVLEDGIINWTLMGYKHERNGSMSMAIAPYDTYTTSDGFVSIGVSSDYQWEKFCRVMGMEDMLNDPRFATNGKRGENYISGGLRQRIESITSAMSKFEVQEKLDAENIPCGSVCTVLEAMESEQLKHRQMIVETKHPEAGKITMPGIPAKLGITPGDAKGHAPSLGQHSREYLKMLDYQDDAVEELFSRGVFCAHGEEGVL
jgi:CoA:oxalate CoA-transferase